jgi:hypothetical protein
MHALHTAFAEQHFDTDNVAAFLDELVAQGMALKEQVPAGTHYLGLALMPQRLRPALEAASLRRLQVPLASSPSLSRAHAPATAATAVTHV